MRSEGCETTSWYSPSFFAISLLVVTEPFIPDCYCHRVVALTRQHSIIPSIFNLEASSLKGNKLLWLILSRKVKNT
jgi:hypothetical protein